MTQGRLLADGIAPDPAPGRAEMLALSLPTFIFSGYELARKTYLPVLLVGAAGLDMGRGGLILTIVGGWSVVVEVLFGMVCDLAPYPRWRRSVWVVGGTLLQWVGGAVLWCAPTQGRGVFVWLLGLLPLASGWVMANLAHGAWALERIGGVVGRGRVFGARAQAGMAGSILFALALLWRGAGHGPAVGHLDDFYLILALTLVGAPLAHGLLIWRVRERAGSLPARLDWGGVLKPFRVCIASAADRWLAALFFLVGGHMAVMGSSFLFLARDRLALPDWGTPGVLMQSLAALVGTGLAPGLLRLLSPLRLLACVFAINLMLALALPWLPMGQVAPFLAWSAGAGATMAVDFMLLRVVLGQRLDRESGRDGGAPAAAFYAGFHLPFNIGVMVGTALLFRGLVLYQNTSAMDAGHGSALAWLTCGLAVCFLLLALTCTLALSQACRAELPARRQHEKLNIRFSIDEKLMI